MLLSEIIDLKEKEMKSYDLEFGEFMIMIPTTNEEAEKYISSLGASGMEPYEEQALGDNSDDQELFANAAAELKVQLRNVKEMLQNLLDTDKANAFYQNLVDIQYWIETGYKKSLEFDEEKNSWVRI